MSAAYFPVMRSPRTVDIAITHQCNLRCTYCSHFSSAGDVGYDLPAEDWRAFFSELEQAAVLRVILQGGEPFARKDILPIIDGIVRHRMRFQVLTNGTLIDDRMAAHVAKTDRCDSIQVSIDGSTARTHEKHRGEGTFSRAVAGVEILKKHNVDVSVRVTIHRENFRDLPDIARFLLDDIGLAGFSTNAASHFGLCRQHATIVQLDAATRSEAMALLVELERRYPGRISASAGPLAEVGMWANMAAESKAGVSQSCGSLSACSGPLDTLAVRADGIMVPCIQLSHITLGRINRDDMQTVWRTHPELNRLRRRYETPLSDFPFCRDCEYKGGCTGNCPAIAYQLTGSDHHPSPDACLKRFLNDGGQLPQNLNSYEEQG